MTEEMMNNEVAENTTRVVELTVGAKAVYTAAVIGAVATIGGIAYGANKLWKRFRKPVELEELDEIEGEAAETEEK